MRHGIKKVGDPVKKGDVLADIETDKATMELRSYKDGTLLHIGTNDGGKLQVNDLLAIIGAKGEDVSALVKEHSGGGAAAPQTEAPQTKTDKEVTAPSESNAEQLAVEPHSKEAVSEAPSSDTGENKQEDDSRVKASPLAKKLAAEKRH